MKNIITKILGTIIALSLISSNGALVYAMSSNNYSVETDSVNFSGGNSSSAAYNLESTIGEVGTGDINSASFKNAAGYQQQFGTDSTDPSIPTSLVATAISSSRIDLSWNASTDNIGVSGYRIFRDSQIISTTTSLTYSDIGLSASTAYSYTVEAFDSSINYSGQSSVATATTSAATVVTTPGGQSTSGSVYPGFIGGALLSVNPINFTATARTSDIYLNWNYPVVNNIQSVVLVRSSKFYPSSVTDGDVVFTGNALNFTDSKVSPATSYYYALFAQDVYGNYSSGVLAYAYISATGEVVATSTTPFPHVVKSNNVHPIIAALTIYDFDFIQDDRKIENASGTIAIDGSKNLLIRLNYKKVPEVLKTIAFSLHDVDDASSTFTFLLRVNKSKTAYEATIAPLGKTGTYAMDVMILDYKNQGLKQLQGSLRAMSLGAIETLAGTSGISIWTLILLLILILIASYIGYRIVKKRHD